MVEKRGHRQPQAISHFNRISPQSILDHRASTPIGDFNQEYGGSTIPQASFGRCVNYFENSMRSTHESNFAGGYREYLFTESIDRDGISALSVISDDHSDSGSVTSIKSDSYLETIKAKKIPLEPLRDDMVIHVYSDDSVSLSRSILKRSVDVLDGKLYKNVFNRQEACSPTVNSINQVYEFVSGLENGLLKRYAGILLKNRISWNVLMTSEVDDLTDLGIPKIHCRYILSEIKKEIIE